MKLKYRTVQRPDPMTGKPTTIRVGLDDRFAVPRRHRVSLDRVGPEARANRLAERRAARAWNLQHHRQVWPPYLPEETPTHRRTVGLARGTCHKPW